MTIDIMLNANAHATEHCILDSAINLQLLSLNLYGLIMVAILIPIRRMKLYYIKSL